MGMVLHSVKIFTYGLLIFVLVGCSTFANNLGSSRSATVYDRNGMDVLIEPTTGNSFVLTDEKVRDQFCMAPPPDLSDVKGSSGSVSVKGVSLSDNTSVSVAALGGRSPAVLISREILFRTCEIYVNLRLTKDDALALFKDSISRVIDVTKTQIAQGTRSQINAGGDNNQDTSSSSGSGGDSGGGAGGRPSGGSADGPSGGPGGGSADGPSGGPGGGSADGPSGGPGGRPGG
jgi:hypothetical protein